jgi:hypothetical protein
VFVSQTPATGTDGIRLSDTDGVGGCELRPSGTNEGVYQVSGTACEGSQVWTTVPGTYYWQIRAAKIEYGTGPGTETVYRHYASPIFTIYVGHPIPPPMATPPPMETPPQTAPRPSCNGKYAKIGGHGTCLHSGAKCSPRYRRQYAHYHYGCVRQGRRYRLVRR